MYNILTFELDDKYIFVMRNILLIIGAVCIVSWVRFAGQRSVIAVPMMVMMMVTMMTVTMKNKNYGVEDFDNITMMPVQ